MLQVCIALVVVVSASGSSLQFWCFGSDLAVASLGVLGLVALHAVDFTMVSASSLVYAAPRVLHRHVVPSSMPVGLAIVIVALSVVLWLRPHGAHLLRHHRLLRAVHSFSPPRPPHVSLNGFMTLNTTNKTTKSILQGTEPRHAPCREGRVSPRQIVDQQLGVHNCSQTVFIMC